MANIFDYLEWRADVPMSADPFNEVDNLVLAELAYAYLDGLVPEDGSKISIKELDRRFFEKHSREDIKPDSGHIMRAPLLMDGMASGSRFGRVKVSDYVNIVDGDCDMQMSALTYYLSDGTAYVAFRGTDNSVVGWKEDFNMSYQPVTEGQQKAVEYLNRVGAKIKRPIRVGGHSKGGNFAVYAAAFCDPKVRKKIIEVYTNDGPGFRKEVLSTENSREVLPKVMSIVPDTSIIGMLLTSRVKHTVVKSSGRGFEQHDALTWQVRRNRFERAELSELARYIRKAQRDWLSEIDDETRESFVTTLFSLFEATGLDTFGEIKTKRKAVDDIVVTALLRLPKEKRKELGRVFGKLIKSTGRVVWSALSDSEYNNMIEQ